MAKQADSDTTTTTDDASAKAACNVMPFSRLANRKAIKEVEALTQTMREAIGDWEPSTNKRWHEYDDSILPAIRFAWVSIVHKESTEVRDIVRNVDGEALAALMRNLNWTGGYLRKLSELCEAAELRLMAHGAPAAVQDWLNDNPLPPEPPQNWRAS